MSLIELPRALEVRQRLHGEEPIPSISPMQSPAAPPAAAVPTEIASWPLDKIVNA